LLRKRTCHPRDCRLPVSAGNYRLPLVAPLAKVSSARQESRMLKQFCDIINAVLRLRIQLRFGRLSRAPLRLLRLEWRGDHVDCDWIARLDDEWDKALPPRMSDGNAALQALEDAIVVRELLFYALHDISSATFRVYRQLADEPA